jgi:YHS domain-containing protein
VKKILVLCLVMIMTVSIGCGNDKPEKDEDAAAERMKGTKEGFKVKPQETPRSTTARASRLFAVDPVDGKLLENYNSKYYYVYKDVEYRFNSEENMLAFRKDPEKYLERKIWLEIDNDPPDADRTP